jgi:acid stress-induced BolA-like protein IbaG/YrbA
MEFKEKVKRILEQLEVETPVVTIEPGNGYRVVAEVVSPSFDAMDEGERQMIVWSKLLDELADHEQSGIDTIFTNSPSEHQELMSGSNPLETDVPI